MVFPINTFFFTKSNILHIPGLRYWWDKIQHTSHTWVRILMRCPKKNTLLNTWATKQKEEEKSQVKSVGWEGSAHRLASVTLLCCTNPIQCQRVVTTGIFYRSQRNFKVQIETNGVGGLEELWVGSCSCFTLLKCCRSIRVCLYTWT